MNRIMIAAAFCAASGMAAFAADPGTTRDKGMDFNKPLNFKVHFIEKTATPPVIDGKLDEACWQAATPLDDFAHASPVPPIALKVAKTEMRYLWDDKYLYLAVKCWEDTPENMASYHKSIAQKAQAIHGRDVLELHVDGKNDEWTKHTMWISGSGEKAGIWDYDFGWGLLTDSSWGVSADWTEVVGEGKDANGDFWCVEVRIALADLEIKPQVGYIFGMEPTRFRFAKKWFTTDGVAADTLPGGVNGGCAGLQIYGWGTQGCWHQKKERFGKCILVEKKPADLVAGLRLAYPDLDKRTVRIRSTDGFLAVKDGKVSRESYLGKGKSLLGEARAAVARLDPILAVTDKSAEPVVKGLRKSVGQFDDQIKAVEAELASVKSIGAVKLDEIEKKCAKWIADVDVRYYQAVRDLLVRERKVRFPIKLDPGKEAPDFKLPWGPDMTEWKDPTCVKWAIPSAAGRKKVLTCVYYGDTFAVQHLMNRIDVDCDIVEVKYNRFINTPQSVPQAEKLERALARTKYDGIVFIGCGPEAWPDRLKCRLAELQLEGVPVALVNGGGWGSDFKDDKDFLLGAPTYFDKLVSDHPALQTGRPESVATGPSPYALHWAKGFLKALRVGSFGPGRVVSLETEHPECGTYIVHPILGPSFSTIPDRAFQDEYCLAYSCRAILEGLGMRGPAKAKSLVVGETGVRQPFAATLTVTSAAAWTGVARVTLRDNWGKPVEEQSVPVTAAAGESTVAVTFGAREPGEYWADAVLATADGKACDFAAQRVLVKADFDEVQITSVKSAKECFEKDEDAVATAQVANAEAGAFVTAELRDPRYRILARGDFPVDAKTGLAEIRFPADRMRLNCHFVLATAKDADGKAFDRSLCWFFRRIGDLEDYRVFDGTTNHGGKDVEPRLAFLAWHGQDLHQIGTRTRLFYGTDPVVRNRIPGKFSNWHGAINSPLWKKWLHDTYEKQAKDLAQRNGRFISLGDDSGCPTAFVKGKCEWAQLFFKRLRPRLERRGDQLGGKGRGREAAYREWLESREVKDVKPTNADYFWGFQQYLEKGSGLVKLQNAKLSAEDVDDIRTSCVEAYGDIRVFNLANGMTLQSFDDITADTIRAFKPIDAVEYPWFLLWLEKRYEGDIAKLNAAWGANEKSFETIAEKTIDELKRLGQWTAEIDKQTFLEDSFLENCRIIGETVHAVDPEIRVGFGASSLNNCILDVFKYLDTAVPYFTREDGDLIRSRKHGYIGETMGWYGTSYGSDETRVPQSIRESQAWHPLLSGANFAWMWSASIGFTGARTMSMNGFGYTFEAHREIQRGPAALVHRAEAQTDGVLVLFSRDGGHMAAVKREPTSHPVARRAWEQTINELQLQYTFVTPDDIAEGALDGAKVLVLPMIDVIRPETAAKISAFLKRGGSVFADFHPGLYGPDGRKLAKGMVDKLIARYPDRFVILDRDMGLYSAAIGKAESRKTRDEFAALFARAGVTPQIRVVGADGQPVDGVEISRFVRGDTYCFSVEKRSFAGETFPMQAFVELPEAGFVYDVRKGESLGKKAKRFEIALQGQDVRFFSFQKYEVKELGLTLNRPLPGGTLRIATKMKGVSSRDVRVLRVEFVPPEGLLKTKYPPIKRYVEDAVGGRLSLDVPMAFNERTDLTVEVTDVASGVTEKLPLVFGEEPKYGSRKPSDVLERIASLSLPEGGRVDGEVVEAGKPEGRTAYYRLTFKAKLTGGRFNYWWIDSFDKDGNVLSDINSKLYQSEDFREYDEIFQAEAKAVRIQPAFCTSRKSHWAKTAGKLEVRDVVLTRISDEEAAAWCDRLYRTLPQIDWSAPRDALWKLPKTWDKLTRHKPIKIVLIGGSLCNDTYNGQVAAQLKRDFPLSDVEVAASLRGGTGVWYYGQDPYFKQYVLDAKPDLLVVAGICHRGHAREADIKDRDLYFQRFIDKCKAHDIELVLCTPPMSKDFRSTTEVQEYDPVKTDPAYIDRTLMEREYLDILGQRNNVPVWDCTTAPYLALAASGAPLEAWMRDIVHCDDRAKQLNARAMVEHFRTAIYYQSPEGRMSHYSAAWFDWGELMPDGRTQPIQFVPGTTTCLARQQDGKIISQTYRLIEDVLEPGETEINCEYSSPNPVVYTARYFDRHGSELASSTLTLKARSPQFERFRGPVAVPKGAVFVRHEFTFKGGFRIVTFGMGKHRMREG